MRYLLVFWIGVSFIASTASAADLIPFGAEWQYWQTLDGQDGDPSLIDSDFVTTWFTPDYDTTTPIPWSGPSPGPFAYGAPDVDGNPNVTHINAFTPGNPNFVREVGTFLDQPVGERYTTYFRTTFTNTVDSPNIGIEFLADDGAKFYLDGEEIVNWNCCEISGPGEPAEYFELAAGTGIENGYVIGSILDGQTIPAGTHTLAVGVHQGAVDSSDMGFSMRLIEQFNQDDLIETGQDWAYFRGIQEPSGGTLDWTTSSFDDSQWEVGPEGFGYELDPGQFTEDLFGTPLPDMETDYTSLYVRKKFEIGSPSDYDSLFLDIDYDDVFIAYINGVEVVTTADADPDGDPTTGIPFDLPADTIATQFAESTNGSGAPGVTFLVDLADFPNLLNAGGDNVLAIHGINRSPSSDYVLAQLGLVGIGDGGDDEPGLRGDFDRSGELDLADVETLSNAVVAGNGPAELDLDGNGSIEFEDLRIWVEDLRRTYFGDSNLDGEFSSRDFVTVFTAQEYEDAIDGNSTWSEGDWNADGDFNTRDFVAAFTGGGYEKGPRPAAVPEPSAIMLLLIGLITMAGARFRA